MINRKFFFDEVRSRLFTGKLGKRQVEGLGVLLDGWEEGHAASDDRWLAYALGTAFHETAFTMQPIHEFGGADYFFRMYDRRGDRPAVAARLGNTRDGDGVLFHGRGYVQLTGRRNYRKYQDRLGIDLTSGPAAADRVLEPDIAAWILFDGMATGAFTGRAFGDYFAGDKADWKNARRIINGLDRADDIAAYAKRFYAAISYTT